MPLIEILKHVPVALNKNLGVLLTVAELLISVSLDALEEVRHEGGLFLDQMLFEALVLLMFLLILRQLLELLQLVSQILEVGRAVVILRREVLLLHGPVLCQLLRPVVLASRHLEALSQGEDLGFLLALEPLDRLNRRILVLLHVLVPRCRELLELLALD